MKMELQYRETVRLLVDIAPFIFRCPDFAMKGGTAINLFHRNMPRLSVDVDVVYIHANKSREEAANAISMALKSVAIDLEKHDFSVRRQKETGMSDIKLFVRQGLFEVKVEVNPVGRGTLYPVCQADLCARAKKEFERNIRLPILAPAELYGSKLVAAMDRQHPRDLFDCLMLRQHEGLTSEIRQAFVAYVTCHNRPINEILAPIPKALEDPYHNNFVGTTLDRISLEMLEDTRNWLFKELPTSLTQDERNFLFTLKAGEPDWQLLPFSHLKDMPAVRWKLQNIRKLKQSNPQKHATLLTKLERQLQR